MSIIGDMKTSSVFCSMLFSATLVAFLFSFSLDIASAASLKLEETQASYTHGDPAQGATVNLFCRLRAGRKTFVASGSGVFVSERGIILTNAHVAQFFLLEGKKGRVKGECSVRTGSPARESYIASILYVPSIWLEQNVSEISSKLQKGSGKQDFALLYITKAKKGSLPDAFPSLPMNMNATAATNTPVTILGYPTGDLDAKAIRKELKALVATSTITEIESFNGSGLPDVVTVASSSAGSHGISSGPIMNARDQIEAVVAIKPRAEDDRRIRGITILYIDRELRTLTGLSLSSILSGDLEAIASTTQASISAGIMMHLKEGLRRRK